MTCDTDWLVNIIIITNVISLRQASATVSAQSVVQRYTHIQHTLYKIRPDRYWVIRAPVAVQWTDAEIESDAECIVDYGGFITRGHKW